jgi:hypothetical protein
VAYSDIYKTTEFNGIDYPSWHGSPFDRGGMDSWYHRPISPHYWPDGTRKGKEIVPPQMKPSEVDAYLAGYEYNELSGGKKDWG